MMAAGVRVPGGFAVTTDAYALHLRSNGLGATIAERLSRIEVDKVDEEETLSSEIRGAIS
jgi:pyruvate, water dikinase